MIPEKRSYADWNAAMVGNRAHRFFRGGRPFTDALSGSQTALDEAKTIRNAIAHESTKAQDKFETLVRTKLGTLPAALGVGRFLSTTVPASTPPQSYLELYLDRIELVTTQIVRS